MKLPGAVSIIQAAPALWFCEMDESITGCDGDDSTILYLDQMPLSCLMRDFLFLWQGFMKGTVLKIKSQFYKMDQNSEQQIKLPFW